MRRRILRVALIAAAVAIILFGVPLVIIAQQFGILDERGEAERFATSTALKLTIEHHAGEPYVLPPGEPDMTIAIYGPDNTKVAGEGPTNGDQVVTAARDNNDVVSLEGGGSFIVAVPVASADGVAEVLWISSPTPLISAQLIGLVAAMAGLSVFAIAVAAMVAARQARRLAQPLEEVAGAADRLGHGDFTVEHTATGVAEIDRVGTALEQTASRLEDILGRERAFSADASHQLRTPLTRIRLGLEQGMGSDSAAAQKSIQMAIAQADNLESVIQDLLTLARDLPHPDIATDLVTALSAAESTYRPILATHARGLNLERPAGEERFVTASRSTAVGQILQVLLDNAVVHGSGAVTVRLRRARETMIIDICDEAADPIGNPEALFVRRSRQEGSAARHGIGLALARSLAEAEGGRLVYAGHTADRGTVFSLFLPPARGVGETSA